LTLMTINLLNENIREASSKQRKGIGIMAYYDGSPGYSFTPELEYDSIKKVVESAVKLAKATAPRNKIKMEFEKQKAVVDKQKTEVKKHPRDIEFEEKLGMLSRGVTAIKEKIIPASTTGMYGELWGEKIFVNSEETEIYWEPLIVDLRIIAIAMDEGKRAVGSDGIGASLGLEVFDNEKYRPETLGTNAGKYCKEQIDAKPAPSGKQRALIGWRLGGVLAHESFGHLSESDFVITGMSPLADKIGERLGSDHATIIDEGTPDRKTNGLWLPYDDQGTRTTKTVLLDKGILKGYLHNRGTAHKMNDQPTGNSRAITFMYQPIPRMKNTYFAPGDLTQEEALEQLGNGIYAVSSSGGQVGLDGNFLFNCSRGYLVENGEIKHAIRDASLSGNILDLIKYVIGATKDFHLATGYFGGCGKSGQFPLPVGLGGPELLVSEVMIGGAK
ncbi:MAG: TldD/PmbA family protein, partial [Candidatus Heimdallarchaeaceae archaeon]